MDSVANTIIMVAKRFIWTQKFRPVRPTLVVFIKYLSEFLKTLKMTFAIRDKCDLFDETWGNIIVGLSNHVVQDEPAGRQPQPEDPPA